MKFIIPKEETKKNGVIKYLAIGAGIALALIGIFALIKKFTKKDCVCDCDCCCDDDCCCDCEDGEECCDCDCECDEHTENADNLF